MTSVLHRMYVCSVPGRASPAQCQSQRSHSGSGHIQPAWENDLWGTSAWNTAASPHQYSTSCYTEAERAKRERSEERASMRERAEEEGRQREKAEMVVWEWDSRESKLTSQSLPGPSPSFYCILFYCPGLEAHFTAHNSLFPWGQEHLLLHVFDLHAGCADAGMQGGLRLGRKLCELIIPYLPINTQYLPINTHKTQHSWSVNQLQDGQTHTSSIYKTT